MKALLFFVGLLLLSQPSKAAEPTPAERDFNELLSCHTNFFKLMQTSKAVWGSVKVGNMADGVNGPKPTKELYTEGNFVKFMKPVEAVGLHLTGYAQLLMRPKNSHDNFWWGFSTSEPTKIVAERIIRMHPNAKMKVNGDKFLWIHEMEKETPVRMLTIDPSTDKAGGSIVRCGVSAGYMQGLKKLPPITSLFQIIK